MQTNKLPITVIISTIALMALACVATVCLLSYLTIEIPPELNTLTAGLVGALSAMLVKTSPTETTKSESSSPGEPAKVEVVSSESDPVHTTEAKP